MANSSQGLHAVAAKMYSDGAIISAVCHGGAIFPGIHSPFTGKSIIADRKVTGFTTKGEEEEGVLDTIKSWNRPTIEKSAADVGAICKCAALALFLPGRKSPDIPQMSPHPGRGTALHRQMGGS